MQNKLFVVFFSVFTSLWLGCDFNALDTTQEKLLPKDLALALNKFQKFDVSLWNYIILDNNADVCESIKTKLRPYSTRVLCSPGLSENKDFILSYLNNMFWLFPPPDGSVDGRNLVNSSLTLLSMPLGSSEGEFLDLIRRDPFSFRDNLLKKVSGDQFNGFDWVDGYLKESGGDRRIIPIQFNFKADQFTKTEEVVVALGLYDASLLGRHYDFYSNKFQIEKDIGIVSTVSLCLVFFTLLFLIRIKRFNITVVLIPSIIATLVSFIITYLISGPIHGLTLSFGIGIIGLGMDYAIHLAFAKDKGIVHKSNLYGLVTTAIVFVTFYFSSIDLISEMMLFAGIGLFTSFLVSSIVFRTQYFEPILNIQFKKQNKHVYALSLMIVGLLLIGSLNIDLSVRRFNFSSDLNTELQDWFYSKWGDRKLFFKTYERSYESNIEMRQDFIRLKNDYPFGENIANYIPPYETRVSNLNSWKIFLDEFKFSENEKKIFAPFFTGWHKDKREDISLDDMNFIKHLVAEDEMISLWFVSRDNKKSNDFFLGGSESLENKLMKSSEVIFSELKTFIGITLISIFVLLLLRYKSITLSFSCLIPFLFSLGILGIYFYTTNSPVTFMSLVGILLLYGLSVDYGIFSTDFYSEENNKNIERDLNSSLLLSWCSSFIGFFPLIFCKHNVLNDLGTVVIIGLFGILYSTFFVLPSFVRKRDIHA